MKSLANIVPSKKIMSKLGKTNAEFELIEEGDKILVGLSGGKDSLTMIHAMAEQQRRAPFKFEFIAVTVGYGMGENYDDLAKHCKDNNIEHIFHDTKIYELAEEKIRKNSSFCSFFSRMRRGTLYAKKIDVESLRPIVELTHDRDTISYQENILEFLQTLKEETLHKKKTQIAKDEENLESKY